MYHQSYYCHCITNFEFATGQYVWTVTITHCLKSPLAVQYLIELFEVTAMWWILIIGGFAWQISSEKQLNNYQIRFSILLLASSPDPSQNCCTIIFLLEDFVKAYLIPHLRHQKAFQIDRKFVFDMQALSRRKYNLKRHTVFHILWNMGYNTRSLFSSRWGDACALLFSIKYSGKLHVLNKKCIVLGDHISLEVVIKCGPL